MLNPVTPAFEDQLRSLLPAAAFKEDTAPYMSEPRGRHAGQGIVIAPGSTDEVATLVGACAEASVGIIPYGGGTGLVGGQLTDQGPKPVVLSLERMNKIRAIYPTENVLVCDAGVILADVQKAAEDVDRLFPLSLASEGSARVGANAAGQWQLNASVVVADSHAPKGKPQSDWICSVGVSGPAGFTKDLNAKPVLPANRDG